MIPLTRRHLIGSTLLAPALAGCTARAPRAVLLEGLAIDSESVQLSCYSSDGLSGFTARLGRFPGANVSWVWAHVFLPELLVGYTDDRLPDARRTDTAQSTSWRQGGGLDLSIVRTGSAENPGEVTLSGRWRGHANPTAGHGPGDVPVALHARFTPARSVEGVLTGRSEAKGQVSARVVVGKRTVDLLGDGHYHEQRQSVPRFTTPFVYLRGSSADQAFTFIKARNPSGALVTDAGSVSLRTFDITAPAPKRQFRVGLANGRTLEGSLTQTHQFWLPIFGSARFSQIATGVLDGRPWVGGVNDWLGGELEYWQP